MGIRVQDEYGTPQEVLDQACELYNIHPHLDVCSNKFNAKFYEYITMEQDALKQVWDVDFFMNPPYSKIADFMRYAYDQHLKYNVDALILTYSKTDTRWWHDVVEGKAEVHFIKGRLKFKDIIGKDTPHPAPYPSCWIIYRKSVNV